jgi:hypothetical protein
MKAFISKSGMNMMKVMSRLLVSFVLAIFGYDVGVRALTVEAEDSTMVFDYYMHVWKIFYACYFVLPFLR